MRMRIIDSVLHVVVESDEELTYITNFNTQAKPKAKQVRATRGGERTCTLCNQTFDYPVTLRKHLDSKKHALKVASTAVKAEPAPQPHEQN
jgi:IMP cyclohydrolase